MATFRGKRVIITGASAGIGAELAIQLAEENAELLLVARRREALEDVASRCRQLGAQVVALLADVSRREDCEMLAARCVEALGGIDVLLLNAGISMYARFEDVEDLSIFDRIMQTNFMGAVYCTHAALPHLKRSAGQIVVVSSLAGKTGLPTRTAYAASKHALHGFFESLRGELHGTGVGITIVCPGPVLTDVRTSALTGRGDTRGRSSIDESGSMSAEQCARAILRAARRRKREEIMTWSGKAGAYLRLFFPGLIDRVVRGKVGL